MKIGVDQFDFREAPLAIDIFFCSELKQMKHTEYIYIPWIPMRTKFHNITL